jgi:hypothetical protein
MSTPTPPPIGPITRRRYRRKPDQFVVAVQLKLDTPGFSYQKWGHAQHCQAQDWLVDNQGDVYTVSATSFAQTYRQLSPGCYVKRAPVWAEQASHDGKVATQEGHTAYVAGDYLVSNQEDGSDAYAVSAEKFKTLYELDEPESS